MSALRVLAVVDVENIFHGFIRLTGSPKAKIDFKKLRDFLHADRIIAYVLTPIEPGQTTGPYCDEKFLYLLSMLGYEISRGFTERRVVEGEKERFFKIKKDSVHQSIHADVMAALPLYDRVIFVSGEGGLLTTAMMVKDAGKQVCMMACVRAGDLHQEYRYVADEILVLGLEFAWTGKKP